MSRMMTSQRGLLLPFSIMFIFSVTIQAKTTVNNDDDDLTVIQEFSGGVASKGYIIQIYDDADTLSCSSSLQVPGQNLYNSWVMAFFYFLGLCYCFLGVSIVADLFMGAIEVITSKEVTKETVLPSGEIKTTSFLVWNPTIANLSLMALGSSAPEILLSVIGAMQDLGTSNVDELGPGTIVGSAAFNLLVISAICIVAIPDGQGRFFYDLKVFAVTATASIFAYIWLFIVLKVWTPDYVTVEEGLLTFAFFPLMLGFAYCADKGLLCFANSDDSLLKDQDPENGLGGKGAVDVGGKQQIIGGEVAVAGQSITSNREDMRQFMKQMKEDGNDDIGDAGKIALARFQDKSNPKKSNWLTHRRQAIRSLAGKNRIVPTAETIQNERALRDKAPEPLEVKEMFSAKVEFATKSFAVNESVGILEVPIVRQGNLNEVLKFQVRSRDGTAQCEARNGENADYEKVDQLIEFPAGVAQVVVPVTIIDDDEFEPDEDFFLDLQTADTFETLDTCKIEIIDDDAPGILAFEFANYTFVESQKYISCNIIRRNGASGKLTVEVNLLEESAKNNVNFIATEIPTVVTFEHLSIKEEFKIPLIDTNFDGKMEVTFKLKLANPTGSATLSALKLCSVTISNDAELMVKLDRLQEIMEARARMKDPSTSSWGDQFKEAVVIKGEVDEITGEETMPSDMAHVMHFLTIGWKVLFALVPPTHYHGGWAAFGVAVAMIGILTAVIGDIATLFGCALGIPQGITAITFVALGTSLPDTFASAQAAQSEDYADSAIGNITGSNAVNVFLGLGLPWMLSSIYWVMQGDSSKKDILSGSKGYYLPAGDLAFSVVIFLICATIALVAMVIRHFKCGGVLGGIPWLKKPTAALFVGMWFFYVIMASLKMVGVI